jgi:Ca2+-binding RTX toxin-like protein
LARDVLEFGPGLTAADLAITVTVDSFSAADHPERPWINGGRVSIRWGAGGGVDLDAPALDFGHEGPSLLSGGWVQGVAEGTREDGSWRGFRLDEGIEAFRFADGTTLDIDQLLANATVVPVAGNYIFRRDSGYQLIDRRYGAVEFVDGIAPSEIAVRRDGRDLLLDAPGAQGRIRDWYADSADMPQTRLNFPFDPEIDAPTLIARGLEIHGTSRGETLTGLDGFNDVLFGEGGNDTIDGQGGNDTLSGGPDHDLLLGGSGEDELTGGLGDDALVGGAGKDTYAFNRGDGVDVITDAAAGAGDGSVIVLGPDLFLARLQPGPGTLVVNLGVAAQNETEVIHFGAFNAEDPFAAPVFDRLQFDDGSSMTYQEVLAQGFDIAGTEDNDVLNGTALVDRMQGAGGNDTLAGRAGDDLLDGGTGDDVLDGGAGADFLAGGEGNDTYVFGRGDGGDDFIMDIADPAAANPGTLDTVSFRAEVLPSEVMVSIAPDGRLFFTIMGTPDRLTIDESLGEPGRIERAVFADGTTWDRATIEARIVQEPATTLRNVITGTGGDELIDALAGDDEIYGLGSNDIIEGGIGDDYIEGNAGSDILRGGEGADGLADGQGNNFFDGGAGDDFLHADGAPNFVDGGSNFILGGAGDDWVNSYAAGNVIAFNPGDGHDSVYAVNALTLSLGGGIASSALSLSQDGIDLVLAIGVSDSIRLTRQFEADPAAWPQITLQLFGSVHFYDFNAVIADFRQAVTADPLLQEFALDGVLQGHQTAVSETEAFGGALAHLHATTGDLNGLSDTAIRQVLGAPDFGAAPQTIQIEGARPGRILIGTPDDDVLTGTEFDDVIDGLRGDDSLGGGLGSDVYRHAPKGGNDVIKETGGADTLLLGVGLAPGMVRLERRHDDLLVNLSGRDGSVTVKGWFASDAQKVETIQFADGTAWGVDYIRSHLSRVKPPQPGQDDDDHDHHHHHHGMDNDPHGKQDGGKHDDPDNDRTEHRKPNLAGLLEAYLARRPDYDFEALARELDRSNHHGEALNTHEIARRWQAVDRYVKGLADERDEDARLGAGEWRSFDAPSLLGGGLSGGAFGHAGSTGGTHGMANLKTLPGLEEGFHRLRT